MEQYKQNTVNIWFPNQVEPEYDPLDTVTNELFILYWKKEKRRCINGFYLDKNKKIFISGWLYWHTVYWKIAMYQTLYEGTDKERRIRELGTPILRDIEFMISADMTRALLEGKFYVLVGARGFGKSIIAASYAAYTYTFFDNSQAVISAGAAGYIKLVTDKIEDGLSNIHPVFKKNRLVSNWKEEIMAGWKDKTSNTPHAKSSRSQILVKNFRSGNDSMACNGTRPGFHLIDEIGTLPNLIGCYKDSDGCWWASNSRTGKPSCLVFLTGCVCAGTKVYTKEGKVVNIEELKKEDGIIGYDGKCSAIQNINFFKAPSKKLCYKITTDNNTIIECSDDHPLLMTRRKLYKYYPNNKKIKKIFYQEAKDLKINDQLITIDEVPIFGNLNEPDSRLIGLMIGDGNYSFKSTPTLSVSEKEIYNFVKPFSNGSSHNYEINETRSYKQVYISYIKNKLIDNKMYGQTKENKRLPINIHEYDKESLCELLAGYFDADGNVYYNNKSKIVRVVLTSIVFELLEQVKYQLLKLGIHCSIIKEKRNTIPTEEYKGQKNYIYRLYISQQQDILNFKQNINLLVEEKRNKLNYIKQSKYSKFDGVFEINPLNNKEGFFNIEEEGNNILKDLRYETIKKIEIVGQKEVYNLNCSVNHNYISNSLITRQTGGDMEVGAEAAEMFYKPKSYNLLEFDDTWEGSGKIGRFVEAGMGSLAYFKIQTLNEYFNIPVEEQDLSYIKVTVSDIERYDKEWWTPKFEEAKKSGNSKTLLKFKAYWCKKPSDSFIVLTKNDFDVESAKVQKDKLVRVGNIGFPVKLSLDEEGRVIHEYSDKLPITEFPVTTQSKDGPVIIYEPPMENPPFGLYTAGVDPYRHSESDYSDSLGAIYIFKRIHSIGSEKFQNMFVACYVARPKDINEWNETARRLVKYYNARTLCENDEMSFINYMVDKGDGHYLEDQPEWLREIVPNSRVNRKKGIHRSSKQIRNFLDGQLKEYLEEILDKQVDEVGSTIKEILGVSRIPDPMLLEEVMKFDKEKNFDRIIAAQLAITLANKLNPVIKVDSLTEDDRLAGYFKYFENRKNNGTNNTNNNSNGPSLFKRRTSYINNRRRVSLF